MNSPLEETLMQKWQYASQRFGQTLAKQMFEGALSAYQKPKMPRKVRKQILLAYKTVYDKLFAGVK